MLFASPLPTQTMSGFEGATATSPSEMLDAWSQTGAHVVPAFSVFHSPPVAEATYITRPRRPRLRAAGPSGTATSAMRPLMTAGPSARGVSASTSMATPPGARRAAFAESAAVSAAARGWAWSCGAAVAATSAASATAPRGARAMTERGRRRGSRDAERALRGHHVAPRTARAEPRWRNYAAAAARVGRAGLLRTRLLDEELRGAVEHDAHDDRVRRHVDAGDAHLADAAADGDARRELAVELAI